MTQYPLCVLKHCFLFHRKEKTFKFTDKEKRLSCVRGDCETEACTCLNVNRCAVTVANAQRIDKIVLNKEPKLNRLIFISLQKSLFDPGKRLIPHQRLAR